MSAAMPTRGDFYYFVPTFLRQEFGSCVQKKGTTATQVVAVESDIFKGITAFAINAVCNFRAASQVTELVLLAWIFFVRVVGSQIFIIKKWRFQAESRRIYKVFSLSWYISPW